MAQLKPLPLTVSCFSKIQIGFAFLVPAHLGSPGKRAGKRVCVCVCVCGWYGRYCSVRPAPEMAAIMALSAAAVAHPTAQLMDVVAEAAHIFTVLLAAIVANTQNTYI